MDFLRVFPDVDEWQPTGYSLRHTATWFLRKA